MKIFYASDNLRLHINKFQPLIHFTSMRTKMNWDKFGENKCGKAHTHTQIGEIEQMKEWNPGWIHRKYVLKILDARAPNINMNVTPFRGHRGRWNIIISFYQPSSSRQTAERYAFCLCCNSYNDENLCFWLEICIVHMGISGKYTKVTKYKMKNCRMK